MPCLELIGVEIEAKLGSTPLKSLQIDRTQLILWTDTMISLHRIQSSVSSKPVMEIQTPTDPAVWSHCPGKTNPAQLPTRGLTVQDLKHSALWWNEPSVVISSDNLEEMENYFQEKKRQTLNSSPNARLLYSLLIKTQSSYDQCFAWKGTVN